MSRRKPMSGTTVTLMIVNMLLFFVLTLPALFFAILGLTGGLADTSAAENRAVGLMYFVTCATPLLLLNALLVLVTVITRRREVPPDTCPVCGYDLRGAPGAGCPECGWRRETEATA